MDTTKKIEEATELMKSAEKSLKTGLLKWKPDYNSAADDYSNAAKAFRVAKSYDMCISCLLKAVECYENSKSLFHAAKSYEQVILVLKETNNTIKIEEFSNKAADLYLQHGSPESAAAALTKFAKIMEEKSPEVALRLYNRALDIVVGEDSTRQASELACKVSRILVKLRLYEEAANAIRREICLNQQTESYGQIGRLTVALVLVQLAREDFVAAEKVFKEWGNCCDAAEADTLESLLVAYENQDTEGTIRALNSAFIKHMDVEYAILARELAVVQNNGKNESNIPLGTNALSAEIHNDDTEEHGLC